MMTSNVHLGKCGVIGALGTVNGTVSAGMPVVHVQLENGAILPEYRSVMLTRYHNDQKCQQLTFALQLAHAVCTGLACVKVPRVQHRSMLRMVGGVLADQFRPMPVPRRRRTAD